MQELTLEEQYIKIVEDGVIANQMSMATVLGFDDIAIYELSKLIRDNQLSKEVYTNTLKLWLTKEEITEVMSLVVGYQNLSYQIEQGIANNLNILVFEELTQQRFNTLDKLGEVVGKYSKVFQDKTEQIVSNFYDYYKHEIVRMTEESEQRRGESL
ncbi:hypothetical protein [Vibrio phage JSF2]|uniref:Uncharacterized protein ORF198 n=1 Tax=Vibrio phage ICP1 TaxID=979525 RepID=F1D1M2_9CAUD|nr:hypothetical protein ViPhICP1_gp200 [Vibrio phage ICP1]ADX88692.1 hypothetical protein TUST1-159_00960 [Vibrio phage ICP1_2006_B]ADX88918.1 hypothetical protein TUST1-17_00960 [Vibrio phage ICP1_2006_A]ADX89148.1 hypothetical protein TUST1-15_00980 [Vibrio phage ICP1_2005_A]ADX89378.1 hypothetical protein TUST1-2_00990 [Vibrio phage ICP1_2001_A]APD17944.1 hypothetical protein [Vibrio phage JSF4]ASV41514.1 hypothetical protein [Vibrio phage JSF6]ASV41752.1 hypothetical protein [Vibrio phag